VATNVSPFVVNNGSSATFYGSGGGGGAFLESHTTYTATGGKGYQGVAYILIPA